MLSSSFSAAVMQAATPNQALERAAAPLLRSTPGGSSDAPRALHRPGRRLARRAFSWHRLPMRKTTKPEFSVIVERDKEGYYVASVPEPPGCHTQASSLDKLIERIQEAIELCLEVEPDVRATTEFIGVQRVTV